MTRGRIEFLLAHPGGPFWRTRDQGAWTIPKGVIDPGEEPLAAARREFFEETGLAVSGVFEPLTPVRQPSGKLIIAFAVEADPDLSGFISNLFELEWPRRSGVVASYPEIDRIAWFAAEEAVRRILPGQSPLVLEVFDRHGARD